MFLSAINIYPIKSLKGISLNHSPVEERGLRYDRRWMLIDADNRFISQREYQQLALFEVNLNPPFLEVNYPDEENPLYVPLSESAYQGSEKVQIWNDIVTAKRASDKINHWFSDLLNTACKLVFMPDTSFRMADNKYANTAVSFADGFPFLMISEESLENLNQKLEKPLSMNRFRPNFVIHGLNPHEEDELAIFKIGDLMFNGVKPCARCIIPSIDPETAEIGKEPLKTLAIYRKVGNKILFGENLSWNNLEQVANPVIRVGDKLTIIQKKLNKGIQDNHCPQNQAGDSIGGKKG